MLGYYINNKPLLLSSETSVKIIYYNPACYFKDIPGDVAMGIEIEVNDTNRAILGNPDRFEKYTTSNDREFPGFEIRFSGKLLHAGTLVIQSANKDAYSGWGRNNVGNLGKIHREKFIYDIPAFMQNITFENKSNYDPLTDPYGCPTLFNPDFFRDKGHIVDLTRNVPNPDYVDYTFWQDPFNEKRVDSIIPEPYKVEALTEAFRKSTAYFVNKLNPDNTVNTLESNSSVNKVETDLFVNVLSPMLFLNFILTMLLRDAHFYIDKNAIAEHEDLKKLILYNNFDITHVDFTRTITTVTIPEIPDENDKYYIIPAITFTTGDIQNIIRTYDAEFRYRDLIPKIKLKDFIMSIQNLLNVCFHFHPGGKVDIIDREAIMDSVPIDISNYMLGTWNMGEKKNVTLKFLFSHDGADSMFSEKWEDIDDRRLYEGDPVETAEALELIETPIIGEIRYIIQSNTYAEYCWTIKPQIDPITGDEIPENKIGWKHLSTGFQNGFFNRNKNENEEEEIKTEFSTLFGDQTTQTIQKGNMETMKFAYENFTPRLMFYLGNNHAKSETQNIALDWEKKDKGLLTTRWSKWNRFWCQRQPVERNASMSLNVIDYVSRNITGKFHSREGDFIIETMETEYSINTIGETKITGYKGDYQPHTTGLNEHWFPDNLIMDDTLIDFTNIGLNFDSDINLFPFGL